MRDATIEIRGQRLRVLEAGSGSTLLYLHGASGASWYPLLEALSADRHVIAPEHPSFGRSLVPDWLASVGDLAFFYLDLLEAWGLREVHLVGHSLGGWTAAELAVRNTARLASLTLMAPAGVASSLIPFGNIFAWSPEEHARNSFHDPALVAARLRGLPDSDAELLRSNRAAAARLGADPLLANPQLRHWLHRIDVPTLLVWGEQDAICPFACHEAYLEEITDAELFSLPACGHALHTERADEVACRLNTFLRASTLGRLGTQGASEALPRRDAGEVPCASQHSAAQARQRE